MYRVYLALRYLLTRPINLLGVGGIALSVWALVVVVSLFTGFIAVVEQHVHDASADVSVGDLPPGADGEALVRELRTDPNVAAAAGRLLHHGLLLREGQRPPPPPLLGRTALHGGDQPFLFVLGVDPTAEAAATGFRSWLADPAIPAELRVADLDTPLATTDGTAAVLVGLERLRAEGWRRGDLVVLTSARLSRSADGQTVPLQVQLPLRIAGAYKTHHGGFDGNNVFVARQALAAAVFEGQQHLVHEIAVRLVDPGALDASAARLSRTVARVLDRGDSQSLGAVRTWRQKNQAFLHSVEHQRALLKIVLVVILVVAAFLMLATLSMMVTEKVADIGILTALGGTPLGVTSVFLACGLCITLVGLGFGLVLGTVTAVYLEEVRQALLWLFGIDLFPIEVYNLDRVPCRIDPWWLVQVASMALATGTVVSVLPAMRAARHDPLVSLREA